MAVDAFGLARAALAQSGEGWSAEGHPTRWYELLPDAAHAAAWLALALFAFFVALALRNAARYRAVGALSEADREALRQEVAAAEERTTGEVVVVVLERSDRHPAAEWIAGLAVMLLGSVACAAWLPWDRLALLLLAQLFLGAVGFLAARLLPDFKRRFVSEERASEMSEEQALQEFFREGLHRTANATGVLILVSLFEHRVVVLGDSGIDERVSGEHWLATRDAVLAGLKRGALVEGVRDGVRKSAAVLAEHFPREGDDRNELADHVVVRRE